jgi:hypothetical protein
MIQVNQAFNGEYLGWIFVLIGSIVVLIGILCIFGILDLKKSNDSEGPRGENKKVFEKIRDVAKGVIDSVGEHKILIVAFIGSFATKIANIATYTFGTLLV